MCKKKEADDAKEGESEKEPVKFCSCAPGSGLRTKVCCFFCCADMFEANGQDDDDDEDDGGCCHTKKPWPENPNAPWNKGKCKDVYCIGIFGLFWVGMIAIAVAAFTMGSYHRVIYAMDFNGQSCGTTKGGDGVDSTCPTDSPCDEDLSNKKVITWPRMGTDMVVSIATGFDTTDVQGSIENLNLYGICVEDCPQAGDYICNYEGEKTFLPNKVGASATAAQKKTGVYDCYAEMWSSGVGDVAGIPGMGILSDALMSSACKDVVANCWINPIDTKRMLYRCIPKFWSVKNTGKECVLPESAGNTSAGVPVTAVSPDNPACITYKQTGTDVVDIPKGAEVIFDIMAGIAGRVMRSMSDVTYSWYVIAICGFGVSFALSWGWVIFLQYFVSFVVWSTVVVFYVAWVVVTIVLYMKAGILTVDNIEWLANYLAELLAGHIPSAGGIANLVATATNTSSDPTPDLLGVSETYELYFQIAAFVFTGAWFVLIIVGIALYKKIKVAIAILREAAKALQALPTLVFFPLWSICLVLVVATYWAVVMLFLISAGKIGTPDLSGVSNATTGLPGNVPSVKKFESDDISPYLMVIHLLGTLWTLNLIEGIGLTVIATSICAWYFTKEIDWKHASFEEEKQYIQMMHDKPCWSTEKPCCPNLPHDHVLQPCTAPRCFFRFFGCTKCCFFFESCEAARKRKMEAAGGSDDGGDDDKKVDDKKAADGDVEADGESDDGDDVAADKAIEGEEEDLSDHEQYLCAENHGCSRAMCCDCEAEDKCKIQSAFFQIHKGIDYDGDGEIDCAERCDVRPAPGCILYTLTFCCFCQLCCYGCKNPIEKDKCWKKGACRYTIDYLRDEACPRNTRPDIEVCTCFKGYYRAISFHMGSIMIGAFLIAIIQTIRVILVYIERQVKQAMGKKKSKLVDQLFKVIQGIMWCFEQCMKFITRNTYIMVAMRDLGFARACASAVGLLVSNVFVLSLVKIFSVAVIVIGKIIVICASAGLAMLWLSFDPTFAFDGARPLNGTMIQTVLVGISAFAVAQIFFYTFQMTIDTILLCFCEDCYQNDGVPMRNAALREVINANSAKAPVPSSIIYKKGNGKLAEFDILVKTDKWALKDLKKNIKGGNRMDAPGIPAIEEMELVIYDKRSKAFITLEKGKLKKSKIHVIFKRHFPIFMRKKGTDFPESMKDASNNLNDELRECLHKHGIKVHAPKSNPSLDRARQAGKTVEV